jgi:ribosome-associated protein
MTTPPSPGTPPLPSIPPDELRFTFVRSSGSGGQHVNKVSSKAVLRWCPATSAALSDAVRQRFIDRFGPRLAADGDLIITSERHRDQGRNTQDCVEKLQEMIGLVLIAPKRRRPTRPSRGSERRRLEGKKAVSEKKEGRRRPSD